MSDPIIVTTPDGQEFEFPAGTSDEVMKAALQREFGNTPREAFGVGLPSQNEFREMHDAAKTRDAGFEQALAERGAKRRAALESDPENIGWSSPKTDAQLGATQFGKADGAFLGFGDEVIGLFNPAEGKRLSQLKDYARRAYPADFSGGEVHGGAVNALATAPVAAPRALQVARLMPRGTQAATAGATSAVAWDTAQQLGTGQGDIQERVEGIDTDRTKTAAVTGGVLGGTLSLFTRSLNNGQSEFGTLLEGLVDDTGTISDDGVRGLERFLKSNGIALDDVTLGRINGVVQDGLQSRSEALALPVRVKDILIDAFEDGSGSFRKAVETHLRGTMVQGGDGAARIAQTVDEDVSAARVALDENYGRVLGKKARIKSEDQTKEKLAQIGREGYQPVLERGPTNYQGARVLDEVLNGPGMKDGRLLTPLKEYAWAEGLELDDLIKDRPLEAAHWMQSKARELVASGQKHFGGLRSRLLRAIEEAAPGVPDEGIPSYAATRKKYGDEFGNMQALEFGDKFLAQSKDAYKIDTMKRAFSELSPRQKNIALLSVRDALRSASGKGRRNSAPRLSRVGDEQVLDALEHVFGKRGSRVAQGIEEVGEFVQSRQNIDARRGSPTAPNQEASQAATQNVQSPLRRKVGGALQNIAGDTALTASGFGPLNSFRAGIGRAGQAISGDVSQKVNALAEIFEAPVAKPQTSANALAPRATPARGPDGKFISKEKARELGIEVEQPNALSTQDKPVEAGFFPQGNTFPVLAGAYGFANPQEVPGTSEGITMEDRVAYAAMLGLGAKALGKIDNRGGGPPAGTMTNGIGGRRRKDVLKDLRKEGEQFPSEPHRLDNPQRLAEERRLPQPNEVSALREDLTKVGVVGAGLAPPAVIIAYNNYASEQYKKNKPAVSLQEFMSAMEDEMRSREGLPPTPSVKPQNALAQ
ncbi:MAG: hypothetical protein AAFY24_01850 [Pseudomonadota bacterium]